MRKTSRRHPPCIIVLNINITCPKQEVVKSLYLTRRFLTDVGHLDTTEQGTFQN